jgi:hypothetical protein
MGILTSIYFNTLHKRIVLLPSEEAESNKGVHVDDGIENSV